MILLTELFSKELVTLKVGQSRPFRPKLWFQRPHHPLRNVYGRHLQMTRCRVRASPFAQVYWICVLDCYFYQPLLLWSSFFTLCLHMLVFWSLDSKTVKAAFQRFFKSSFLVWIENDQNIYQPVKSATWNWFKTSKQEQAHDMNKSIFKRKKSLKRRRLLRGLNLWPCTPLHPNSRGLYYSTITTGGSRLNPPFLSALTPNKF